MKPSRSLCVTLFSVLIILFWVPATVVSSPPEADNRRGKDPVVTKGPARVVSLIPSATEIIFKIGAGDAVQGVTHHDAYPAEANTKKIVGGFFSPSIQAIEAIGPDVIFHADFHRAVKERFGKGKCRLIEIQTHSIADSYKNIFLLGKIFNKEKAAADLVAGIKAQLKTVAGKVAGIPREKRKRVIRLMGRDVVMTPGDNSFQSEMIRAAGGIPPRLGKNGNIVGITKEEWMRFNPQIIYGCGGDRESAQNLFDRPGWNEVDAVKKGNIFFFPCDLTCRAATRTGDFVSWLSSRIYTDEFSTQEDQTREAEIIRTRSLGIDLDYVKNARVLSSRFHGFTTKTLVVDFTQPLSVVSTLEGERSGIESVGNHYASPPCWVLEHRNGVRKIREHVCGLIGKTADRASFLFTGVDMDNLAVEQERFEEMAVYALVTAGVTSNALRMSKDQGRFYEPGTINIILLPNMELAPRAMVRAIICATEAKTAALMDLDVRSSETPMHNQATGTGTDNIIVVQGTGVRIDNAGGHTKMGELIARAVYEGVRKAVYRQNGLIDKRNVFQRLKERHIDIYGLASAAQCERFVRKGELVAAFEEVLLDKRYASFIEASLALSDDYERGRIKDLSLFHLWCKEVAADIAGRKIAELEDLYAATSMPVVLHMSLNALLNGICLRNR
ncbi:MAG: adenosylcobinamide amidohydrolase [Deltaproteobacteria bacterium]|nr:adenosylcobinamide amidohydrolase [Deltaproteobacteria bacterium]